MKKLDLTPLAVAVGINVALAVACTREPVMSDDTETETSTSTTASTSTVTTLADSSGGGSDSGTTMDSSVSIDAGPDIPACQIDGTCGSVDLLFIVDNSGSMGEEQLNLARSFETLVERLENLEDDNGFILRPSINIMVTTTDMGHPLCTPFQKPDYTPAQGAPIYLGCNARINRFSGLDPMNPVIIEEACTENCPVDVSPSDHFIHFDAEGSNVPGDDVATALACIGPQGIDGCGYEAPLETMLQALNDTACWNDPQQESCQETRPWAGATEGFLRDDATLAVVLVTDELDCSVQPPGGFSFFTDINNDVYWNINPDLGAPQATSAVCFNAGVSCDDAEGDGIYEGCVTQDNEALQPVDRYTSYLEFLSQTREVTMLTLTGVPLVVSRNPNPPFEPTAGGVIDLLYRDWIDAPYPAGDILPDEWDAGLRAVNKRFLFGDLGPGCTGQDEQGEFTSQALPPVRIREVCQSLDYFDEQKGEEVVRCCMESVCDGDYDPAFRCLTGTLGQILSTGIVTD